MSVELIPEALRARFRFQERNHATAVLAADFPNEFADIIACMSAFTLRQSQITVGGGGRSQIPITLDNFLVARGWAEKKFDIEIKADGHPIPIPTHKIDNFKNRVGVEVEWNNKTFQTAEWPERAFSRRHNHANVRASGHIRSPRHRCKVWKFHDALEQAHPEDRRGRRRSMPYPHDRTRARLFRPRQLVCGNAL
jgi:hypothetical protein